MSEEKQTIYEALAAVQKAMPVIGRNKTANVGKFSYSYADLEKIWEVAYPIIEANGFITYHFGDGDSIVTVVHHRPSGNSIQSTINITQTDPQKKGAEVTYYRRYNLCMLFNIIVADEDKDAVGTEEVNEEKLALIEGELELLDTVEELTAYYKQLGAPKDKKVLELFKNRKSMLIHEVEQGSKEWLNLKKGRVTGTRLKEVMGKSADKLMYEMIAERFQEGESYENGAMQEGVLRESWAIDEYQEKTGQNVTTVGFVSQGEDVGLSPDGLVVEIGAVEVKSPGLPKHIEYVVKNKLPAEYKWQVVHYFIVLPIEWVDFVSYHPNFAPKPLMIVRVTREEMKDEIESAKEKLEKFLEKYNQTLGQIL